MVPLAPNVSAEVWQRIASHCIPVLPSHASGALALVSEILRLHRGLYSLCRTSSWMFDLLQPELFRHMVITDLQGFARSLVAAPSATAGALVPLTGATTRFDAVRHITILDVGDAGRLDPARESAALRQIAKLAADAQASRTGDTAPPPKDCARRLFDSLGSVTLGPGARVDGGEWASADPTSHRNNFGHTRMQQWYGQLDLHKALFDALIALRPRTVIQHADSGAYFRLPAWSNMSPGSGTMSGSLGSVPPSKGITFTIEHRPHAEATVIAGAEVTYRCVPAPARSDDSPGEQSRSRSNARVDGTLAMIVDVIDAFATAFHHTWNPRLNRPPPVLRATALIPVPRGMTRGDFRSRFHGSPSSTNDSEFASGHEGGHTDYQDVFVSDRQAALRRYDEHHAAGHASSSAALAIPQGRSEKRAILTQLADLLDGPDGDVVPALAGAAAVYAYASSLIRRQISGTVLASQKEYQRPAGKAPFEVRFDFVGVEVNEDEINANLQGGAKSEALRSHEQKLLLALVTGGYLD